MGRRKVSRHAALQGGALSLAEYGRPDLPGFSWDGLPGDDVRAKARAYVDALGLEPSVDRGMILWRVECVLEDSRRGGSSFEDEVLAEIAGAGS